MLQKLNPDVEPDWQGYRQVLGERVDVEDARTRYQHGSVSFMGLAEQVLSEHNLDSKGNYDREKPAYERIAELRENWKIFAGLQEDKCNISENILQQKVPSYVERQFWDDNIIARLCTPENASDWTVLDFEHRGNFVRNGISLPAEEFDSATEGFYYGVEDAAQETLALFRLAEQNDWAAFYREEVFDEMCDAYMRSVERGEPEMEIYPLLLREAKDIVDEVAEPVKAGKFKPWEDEDPAIANSSERNGAVPVSWDDDFMNDDHDILKHFEKTTSPDKIVRSASSV